MIQDKLSNQQESRLACVFQNHEFDIVGLAQIPLDDTATIDHALLSLDAILQNNKAVDDYHDERLAQVLFAMIKVALQYGDDGHRGYWGDLSHEIQRVAPHAADFSRHQHSQALLGDSFRKALRRFGYTIPDEGQKPYVGTILFHAGIPRCSLRSVLGVVAAACRHHSKEVITLRPDIRRALVENFVPRLPSNIRMLFGSELRGPAELWACLSRVVSAWQSRRDWKKELEHLPPALDSKSVRQVIANWSLPLLS